MAVVVNWQGGGRGENGGCKQGGKRGGGGGFHKGGVNREENKVFKTKI